MKKKRILEKSAMDAALTEAFGKDLWAGWPTAFFTFSQQIPKVVHDWDQDFAVARHRVLCYKRWEYDRSAWAATVSNHRWRMSNSWCDKRSVDTNDSCY